MFFALLFIHFVGFIAGNRSVLTRGSNPSNEDTYLISDFPEFKLSLYGVFDGHSGGGASAFVRDRLASRFRQFMETSGEVGSALALALKQVDQDYWSEKPTEALNMGACALVVAVTEKEVVVANLGDSHAIMITPDGKYTSLNRMLNAALKAERERLAAEANITCDPKYGDKACYIWVGTRGLQPTRTIGDKHFHPVITANAEISRFPIPASGARVVLATDGLWDELDAEVVAKIAIEAPWVEAAGTLLLWAGQKHAAERAGIGLDELLSRLGKNSRRLIDDTTIVVFDIPNVAKHPEF